MCGIIGISSYKPVSSNIINSLKNIISDNLNKPSKPLLYFCAKILNNSKIRDDNKYLDQIKNGSKRPSVFVGDLEDAIQSNDWKKAKLLKTH